VNAARLGSVPLFAGLSEEDLAALAEAMTEAEAAEGQILVAEGDFGHALYVIESGAAQVTTDGVPVRTLGPGDVFGEVAVLASGRRTATVVAASPRRLLALFKRDVWELERTSPILAGRLRTLVTERLAATT
jgi:monovalent cation:H+ antiporter, CPA1 family